MQGLPADDVMNADQSTGTLSGNAHSLEYKHTLFCSLISLFIILTDLQSQSSSSSNYILLPSLIILLLLLLFLPLFLMLLRFVVLFLFFLLILKSYSSSSISSVSCSSS